MAESEQLKAALAQTLLPDAQARAQGEKFLRDAGAMPGFFPACLQLVVREDVDVSLKQAAAIQLKNNVKYNWHRTPADMEEYESKSLSFLSKMNGNVKLAVLSEADKSVVRGNIVEAVARSHSASVRKILCEIVRLVAMQDFPDQWPEPVGQSIELIMTKEPGNMHAGLSVLNKVAKSFSTFRGYRDKKPEDDDALTFRTRNDFVGATFPLIEDLVKALVQQNVDDIYAAELLHIATKIFQKVVKRADLGRASKSIPTLLREEPRIRSWLDMFSRIVSRPVGDDQPVDIDARPSWPWWKVKCRAASVLAKMSHQYSNPKHAPRKAKNDETPSEFYTLASAPGGLIESYCFSTAVQVLSSNYMEGKYHPDAILDHAAVVVQDAVKSSHLFKKLKPELPFLLDKVVFRMLEWSETDLVAWSEDAADFCEEHLARKFNQEYGLKSVPNLDHTGRQLLEVLCRMRSQYVMPLVVQLLSNLCETYKSDPNIKNAIRKAAALRALDTLAILLAKDKSLPLESLVMNYVVPELQSPHAFLRVDSSMCLSRFVNLTWSSINVEAQVAQALVKPLADPDIIVRLEATNGLNNVLLRGTPAMMSVVQQVIPDITKVMLETMENQGQEDVFHALGVLISTFPTQVLPQGPALCQGLVNAFGKLAFNPDKSEEDTDLADTAAMSLLETVSKLLSTFSLSKNNEGSGKQKRDDSNLTGQEETGKRVLAETIPVLLPVLRCSVVAAGILNMADGDPELDRQAHDAARALYGGNNPAELAVDPACLFGTIVQIMAILSYYSMSVPKEWWLYVPLLARALASICPEETESVLSLFDTMITYDPAGLVADTGIPGLDTKEVILNMVIGTNQAFQQRCNEAIDYLENEDEDEDDDDEYNIEHGLLQEDMETVSLEAGRAAWVSAMMLESCPGQLDKYIKPIVDNMFTSCVLSNAVINKQAPFDEEDEEDARERDEYFEDPRIMKDETCPNQFLNALSAAFFYNPRLTLLALGQDRLTQYFALAFEHVDFNLLICERMVTMLGFANILALSPQEMPPEVNEQRAEIVKSIATLAKGLDAVRKATAAEKANAQAEQQATLERGGDEFKRFGGRKWKPLQEEFSHYTIWVQGAPNVHEDVNVWDVAVDDDLLEEEEQDQEEEDEKEEEDDDVTSPIDSIDECVFLFDLFARAPLEARKGVEMTINALQITDKDSATVFQLLLSEGQRRKTASA